MLSSQILSYIFTINFRRKIVDVEQFTTLLLGHGFSKEFFKSGVLVGKDGSFEQTLREVQARQKESEAKQPRFNGKYSLVGNYCSAYPFDEGFGENIMFTYNFGMDVVQSDLITKVLAELKHIISLLRNSFQVSSEDIRYCDIQAAARVNTNRNPLEIVSAITDTYNLPLLKDMRLSISEPDTKEYESISTTGYRKISIMARMNRYVVLLEHRSESLDEALDSFRQIEQRASQLVSEIEKKVTNRFSA